MTAWLLLVAFYWWAGCMAGVFPGLRLRHARRLRGTVRFHERVYKRWDSPKRRRMHDGMEEQASNLERRWTRASRFGWWILVAVTAQWFYALAMATEFGDGSDSGTTRQGMAWFS